MTSPLAELLAPSGRPLGPTLLVEMRLTAEQAIREAHLPRVLDERRVDLLASEWVRALLTWATRPRYDHETGEWMQAPTMPRYEP